MPDINLELPYRLKPHLRLDSETGEVVAHLSSEAIDAIRQVIRDEIRSFLNALCEAAQKGKDEPI